MTATSEKGLCGYGLSDWHPCPRRRDGRLNRAGALRQIDGLQESGWPRRAPYWATRVANNLWEYGIQHAVRGRVTDMRAEEWGDFKAYCARVARFHRWWTEGRHRWTRDPASHVYWADNSETIEEVSALTGERRTVTLMGPGGDGCF